MNCFVWASNRSSCRAFVSCCRGCPSTCRPWRPCPAALLAAHGDGGAELRAAWQRRKIVGQRRASGQQHAGTTTRARGQRRSALVIRRSEVAPTRRCVGTRRRLAGAARPRLDAITPAGSRIHPDAQNTMPDIQQFSPLAAGPSPLARARCELGGVAEADSPCDPAESQASSPFADADMRPHIRACARALPSDVIHELLRLGQLAARPLGARVRAASRRSPRRTSVFTPEALEHQRDLRWMRACEGRAGARRRAACSPTSRASARR